MSNRQTRSKTKTDQPSAPSNSASSSKAKPNPGGKAKQDAKTSGKGLAKSRTIQEILAEEIPGASASRIAAIAKSIKAGHKDSEAKQRTDGEL